MGFIISLVFSILIILTPHYFLQMVLDTLHYFLQVIG